MYERMGQAGPNKKNNGTLPRLILFPGGLPIICPRKIKRGCLFETASFEKIINF